MGMTAYRSIFALRDVRRVLLLSVIVRIPMWAANVVLTLHVVSHLGRSYGAAGLLVGVATVALAISAPWRGRRLDTVGLRASTAPSLVVLALCWSVAPFVSYWPLMGLAAVAGLFVIPSFSIVRQALMHAVPDELRRSVLSVDSVFVEISFMIGPVLGVLLATYWTTPWALFSCEFTSILGGILLMIVNPTLRAPDDEHATSAAAQPHPGVRTWLTPTAAAVLGACFAATIVLTGTDVGIVAALRHMDHQSWIGWVLAVWGLGSAVGGVVYGALHRAPPVFVLLALLSAATLPAAFAHDPITLALLLVIAGCCCAPTITATVDALSRAVPERVRGEALGWHGSALTTGSAAGAPLAGLAIDRMGWPGGFVLPSLLGLVAAGAGIAATRRRHRARADEPVPSRTRENVAS
jgi:MFS family permease